MWQYNYQPDSNELCHASHKYISRKWSNGHWVYEYDNNSNQLVKTRRAYQDSAREELRTSGSIKTKQPVESYTVKKTNGKFITTEVQEGKNQRYSSKSSWDKKVYDNYAKSVPGKVDSFMEKNGKKIASSLTKTSASINKAKNTVSGIVDKLNNKSSTSNTKSQAEIAAEKIRNGTLKAKNKNSSTSNTKSQAEIAAEKIRNGTLKAKKKRY